MQCTEVDMNYGFFEELAEILSEQSAAKGREKVSEGLLVAPFDAEG